MVFTDKPLLLRHTLLGVELVSKERQIEYCGDVQGEVG